MSSLSACVALIKTAVYLFVLLGSVLLTAGAPVGAGDKYGKESGSGCYRKRELQLVVIL